MLKKNQTITLTIHDLGSDGEGVGHVDGFVIFVERGLPGELVKARLTEVKKNYARGVIEHVVEASPLRQRPLCLVYEQCGGCQLQHLSYEGQLQAKQKRVKDALERIGHFRGVEVKPCIPSPDPWAYRNKIQLPVVMSAQGINIGFYQHRTHDVIDIDTCPIHCRQGDGVFWNIKQLLLESSVQPYNEISGAGELRYCLIKTAVSSREVLVTLVSKGEGSVALKTLGEAISTCPDVKGVVQNINVSSGNAILGREYRTLMGRPYIYETLGGYTYKVSSASFFQVNTFQAERLYEYAIALPDIQNGETVIDAYCGVGTLSLLLARRAKQVIGIECVPEAIFDAQANAENNGVENVQFHCVHTEKATHLLQQGNVIFLNPPRKGCEGSVIRDLVQNKPGRIVYISCNPATLARDLSLLKEGGYEIREVQPFDMFPQTAHVETVVLLKRQGS